MYVCLCLGVTSQAVTVAVNAGATTTNQVASDTGAGSQCGRCRRNVRAIINATSRSSDLAEELHGPAEA